MMLPILLTVISTALHAFPIATTTVAQAPTIFSDAFNATDFWYWSESTAQATWQPRYRHTMNLFRGSLWIFGGQTQLEIMSDVFATTKDDESSWGVVTIQAPWMARCWHSSVVALNNSIVVLAGGTDNTFVFNDVWFFDGQNWLESTSAAAWPARVGHTSLVFQDKVWIIGGGKSTPSVMAAFNDVWFTDVNSQTWNISTASAAFPERVGHTSVVFLNAVWVLGGATQTNFANDVWFSKDGVGFSLATSSAEWPARVMHSSVVLHDQIWVFGGMPYNVGSGPLFNDIWSSADGVVWVQVTKNTHWLARGGMASVVVKNNIILTGGLDSTNIYLNDEWSSVAPMAPPVTLEPPSGTFTFGVTVELLSAAGAVIYYTTDNTEPTLSSAIYSSPIEYYNDGEFHVRAFSSEEGYSASGEVQADYMIVEFSLNPWRIAAISFGSLVVVVLVGAIFRISYVLFLRNRKKKKKSYFSRMGDRSNTSSTQHSDASRDTTITSCKETWHVDATDLKLNVVVGVGSFCKVWRGTWRGMDVAIKEHLLAGSSFLTDEDTQTFMKEARMLATLRHPHVLQFYGASISPTEMLILTEFCAFGSLRQVLSDPKFDFNFSRALNAMREIALGMNYLHTRRIPIVHRDLKSPNVLLTDTWTAKIADFGVSRLADESLKEGFMTHGVGSPLWSAPEVLQKSKYGVEADVYAYGIVMWECATRHEPYEGLSSSQVTIAAAQGQRPDLTMIPPTTPQTYTDLLVECWGSKPNLRPNFIAILAALDEI